MAPSTALEYLRSCTLLVLLAFSSGAHAQPTTQSDERAAAQVLFDAGRQAMTRNDYDEACAKFEESHRLDPAAGTLLNLGNCEEKRGRPASAWDRYKGAIGQLKEGDRRRVFAEKKIAELMPSVPHLTVHLAEDSPEGSQVWRNETPITGSLGIPLPLNPGLYEVLVEAPSYQPRVHKVELGLGERKTITAEPGDKIVIETKPEPLAPPVAAEPAPQTAFTQSTWGYIAGGVGVASAVTAIALTIAAIGPRDELRKLCPDNKPADDPKRCESITAEGRALVDSANVFAVISALGLGTGAVLILTHKPDEPEGTRVEAGAFGHFTGLRVNGTF